MTGTAETMSIRSAVQRRGTAEERLRRRRRDRFRALLADVDDALHIGPAERDLFEYVSDAAQRARANEEQASSAFKQHFKEMKETLLDSALQGDMYQVGPNGSGMVSFDNTEGTRLFEVALKVMREQDIQQKEFVQPFVDKAAFKTWNNVDPEVDLVFMRYETSEPVEFKLNRTQLSKLIERARLSPGGLDRVRTALAEKGVMWEGSDTTTGVPYASGVVEKCYGRWCACLSSQAVLDKLVSQLSVVEVSEDCEQEGWWDAARADIGMPDQLLPVIRNREPKLICLRSDIAALKEWAGGLPGWSDGSTTPLVMRDAVLNDILQ